MKINYCFVCLTSYQYQVSNIYARQLFERKGKKSLIINKYFEVYGKSVNEYSDVITIPKNIKGKIITGLMAKTFILLPFEQFIRKIDGMVFFNDRDPITHKIYKVARKFNIRTILMEEGLGTYYTKIGDVCLPDYAIVEFPEVYRKYHLAKCKFARYEYPKLFCYENIKNEIEKVDDIYQFDILFLGQITPSSEEYRKAEMEFVEKLTHVYPEYRILIKPHPRDVKPEKYKVGKFRNLEILSIKYQSVPAEVIIYKINNIKIVASLYSSGCITLASIFKDIVLIYGLELCSLIETGNIRLPLELSAFLENLYFPKSMDDIARIPLKERVANKEQIVQDTKLDLSAFE